MKRRKNEHDNGKKQVTNQDDTKRRRAYDNDENQNSNITTNHCSSDIQVKSIYNQLLIGLNHVPDKGNEVPSLDENTPSGKRKNGKTNLC